MGAIIKRKRKKRKEGKKGRKTGWVPLINTIVTPIVLVLCVFDNKFMLVLTQIYDSRLNRTEEKPEFFLDSDTAIAEATHGVIRSSHNNKFVYTK